MLTALLEALVIVAGDGLFVIASFTLAGAILLAITHVGLAAVRRYSPW